MSNTPKVPRIGQPAIVPSGDMGLGLCLQCLGEVIADPDNAPVPAFAITLLPSLWPPDQPRVPVAVPVCWPCLKAAWSRDAGQVERPAGLWVAGKVPR